MYQLQSESIRDDNDNDTSGARSGDPYASLPLLVEFFTNAKDQALAQSVIEKEELRTTVAGTLSRITTPQ